jgi:subtilisin
MEELNKVEVFESLDDCTDANFAIKLVKADIAWNLTMGEGVKVAVIDTGIDMSHPDLIDNFKAGINMFEKSIDVTDEFGHGTHVAGLIAGKKTGIAPNAELYIAKVLNGNGNGTTGSVMDGITFAMNYEVDILCLSLGTYNVLPLVLQQRIIEAYESGITIVCATGNDGHHLAQNPASMNEVIAVGGLDSDLNLASWSNRGELILAPSTKIISTYKDGNYAVMSGTSMASPIVAGGIALLISHYRKRGINLTPTDIKSLLYNKEFDLEKLLELDA